MDTTSSSSGIQTTQLTTVLRSPAVDSCQFFSFSKSEPVQLNPDGHFEFIIQTKGDFQHKTDGKDWEKRPRIFIGGLHNRAFQVHAFEQDAQLISVRLKIEQARNFLSGPLEEYKNKIVDLRDLYTAKQLLPLERLCESKNPIQHAGFIDDFLLGVEKTRTASSIDFLLREIHRLKGDIRLSEMADFTGMNPHGLRKLFAREVGMSPKEYTKIVRFNHVAHAMETQSNQKLTEIAYDMGYFDQAHFIKDFRSITGLAPKAFRRQLAG